jgi:hypothetical protein
MIASINNFERFSMHQLATESCHQKHGVVLLVVRDGVTGVTALCLVFRIRTTGDKISGT